jgi:hypothetical protein
MKHCSGKSVPLNKKLYNSIKKKVKSRSKVWPSAYASGQLVRQYKSKGGKYKCQFGSLDRWFKEKWVNVCKPKGKGYQTCGRSKSSKRGYPYCRPLKRVNSKTPKTVGEIGKEKLKRMCSKKRRNPSKKVFLNFGEKTNVYDNYTMEKQNQTCGFGAIKFRRTRFGNNLGPTNSNLDTFYQKGTANSSILTPRIRKCESVVYGDSILRSNYRFGKKKFIKEAFKSFEKKGTAGSFTRWCKSKGFPKVNNACIKRGKKSPLLKIRRKAIFAQNIRSKKRHYSFGNKNKIKDNLKDISYLKRL